MRAHALQLRPLANCKHKSVLKTVRNATAALIFYYTAMNETMSSNLSNRLAKLKIFVFLETPTHRKLHISLFAVWDKYLCVMLAWKTMVLNGNLELWRLD